jgi:hypothetical protein
MPKQMAQTAREVVCRKHVNAADDYPKICTSANPLHIREKLGPALWLAPVAVADLN